MKFSSAFLFAAIASTPFVSTIAFARSRDTPTENQGNDNGLHPLVESQGNQGNDDGLHPDYKPHDNQGNDDGLHPTDNQDNDNHPDHPYKPYRPPHKPRPHKYKQLCTVNTDNTPWNSAYVRLSPCNSRRPLDTLLDGDTVYSMGKTKYGCGYWYTKVWDSDIQKYGWVASLFLECDYEPVPAPAAATDY
jgi:hypothetical protein